MVGLGALERALMDELWDADAPLPVRDLRGRLNARGDRELAYNTVQTVLDRLARKGLVLRSQEGRAHLYSPARSREDHVAAAMLKTLSDTGQRGPALARFAVAGSRFSRRLRMPRVSGRLTPANRPTTAGMHGTFVGYLEPAQRGVSVHRLPETRRGTRPGAARADPAQPRAHRRQEKTVVTSAVADGLASAEKQARTESLDARQALAEARLHMRLLTVPLDSPAGQQAYLRRLGLHVRVLRTAQRLSQAELAEIAGMDRTYVSRVERGQHNLTVLMLERLARALGVPCGELLP